MKMIFFEASFQLDANFFTLSWNYFEMHFKSVRFILIIILFQNNYFAVNVYLAQDFTQNLHDRDPHPHGCFVYPSNS